MRASIFTAPMAILLLSASANAQGKNPYSAWKQTGAMAILTTPDGADLPAGTTVEQFPLLVRLDKDWFDFSKAKPKGEDLRFSSESGETLLYEIEQWDAAKGVAAIWVRVPGITGNAVQALRMHWGKADAAAESNAKAVFSESNGYLSVWHMAGDGKDVVGTLDCKDTGTTPASGIVGEARHLAGHGINGGENITNFPAGADAHSTEVWFRAEKPNGNVIGWGVEKGQGKVVMQYSSPPHIRMDCYFSEASGEGSARVPLGEWNHVSHTYRNGESIVYVNGKQDVVGKKGTPMNIPNPSKLWVGGWYNNYNFIGDIDEVRISKVTRTAEWVKLQYENQKPLNTLVGPLVQPGKTFSLTPEKAVVKEGETLAFVAQAGGARKLYWILKRDGREEVVATDRFRYDFAAGRVTGDATVTLVLKAVFADGVKTKETDITIKEAISDPVFSLAAPPSWDGRKTIEVVALATQTAPLVSNLEAMKVKGAGDLKITWNAGPLAVIQEASADRLILKRAQNSGKLTVTATISNGGKAVTQSVEIDVKEPAKDAWVARIPNKDEKPEEGQFYPRDENNEGTLHYNGTLTEAADSVFLKLYADDKLITTQTTKPAADKSYSLAVKLKPGLIRYRVEFVTVTGGKETVSNKVGDIVCGDAYLIDGQSNALATDTREESPPETNEWIRSYGRPSQKPEENVGNLWCRPVWKARKGEKAELGWWGMELAKRLLESQKMPIFIINGAVGGTRIDQHQRDTASPTNLESIYGRMLWRIQRAKMTHGIRAILWHQGENDQPAAGPSGDFGWVKYHDYFTEMAAAWKQDFPNVSRYYVFQIWPNSCAMGGHDGAGDRLREEQRTLPFLFSNMSIMSTLGVRPEGGCHYPLAGWGEFARLMQPIIERDFYGKTPAAPVTAPNLIHASFASGEKESITLEFDQPVVWDDKLTSQFYLDGEKDHIATGSVSGNTLTLKLKQASAAKTITYLKEVSWKQDTLLLGTNGIAALTFCEVPLASNASR